MGEDVIRMTMYGIDPTGKAIDIEIRIGKPREKNSEYHTEVAMTEWTAGIRHTIGEDPIQSILLAISLVKTLLLDFENRGGRLYANPARTKGKEFTSAFWFMADQGIPHDLKAILGIS